MKTITCLLTVLIFLVAGSQDAQLLPEYDLGMDRAITAPGIPVYETDTLLLQLEPDLDPLLPHRVRIEASDAERVVAVQDCIVSIKAESEVPVIEIGVGNAELVDLLKTAANDPDDGLQIKISTDGQLQSSLQAIDFVELDAQLRTLSVDPQNLVSISYDEGMPPTLVSVGAKETFECPGAHPSCEDMRDGCISECGGDYYCEKDCQKWYQVCVHGSATYSTTSTLESSIWIAVDQCVWKYVWEILFSYRADGFSVVFREEHWETRTCMNGQTFHTLLNVTYEPDVCWWKFGDCSLGSQVSCFLN